MRLLAIVLLLSLVAWRTIASEEQPRYVVLGSGAEVCTKLASKPGASGEGPGLLRITCDLDGALLSLENYFRDNMEATGADPGDQSIGRSRSSRHKPGR